MQNTVHISGTWHRAVCFSITYLLTLTVVGEWPRYPDALRDLDECLKLDLLFGALITGKNHHADQVCGVQTMVHGDHSTMQTIQGIQPQLVV